MGADRLISLLVDEVRAALPATQAIVLWGGALREAREALSYGDVDLLVVYPFDPAHPEQASALTARLAALVARCQEEHNLKLDPAAIAPEQLNVEPLLLLLETGPYKANRVVQYQLKNESRVIYGHADVLRGIPDVGLREAVVALSAIVLHRVEAMRGELQGLREREEGRAASPRAFVEKHLSSFLVFARTIYSLEQGKIANKTEALEYLAARYPRQAGFAASLSHAYKGAWRDDDDNWSWPEIAVYLDLTQEIVDQEIRAA